MKYLPMEEAPRMTVISLYYYKDDNIFTNDDGEIIYDIYKYVPASLLPVFKDRQGIFYIYSSENEDEVYEIVIPITEDEGEI